MRTLDGVSCPTTAGLPFNMSDFSWMEMHSAAVLGAHVKRYYGKPVLLGGNNLDYLMQFKGAFHTLWVACLEQFDYMVTGPGEEVFLELVLALTSGRPTLPMLRPGVASLRAGNVLRAPDAVHRILAWWARLRPPASAVSRRSCRVEHACWRLWNGAEHRGGAKSIRSARHPARRSGGDHPPRSLSLGRDQAD